MLAACGSESSPPDARPSCAITAEPHDEDGDGIFDACDNCPAIVNPTQTDATEIDVRAFADGVGDACDLRPSIGGDVLRAFYSFASEDQADAWIGSGFTISGDAVHADSTAMWSSARAEQGDGLAVLAQITSATFGAGAQLAIVLDGDGSGAGATCALDAQVLTASEVAGATSSVNLETAIAPDEPVTLIAWRAIGLAGGVRVARLTCRVTHAGTTTDTMVMLSDDGTTGIHAIAVRDASVEMASLSVYTSPGPKNP